MDNAPGQLRITPDVSDHDEQDLIQRILAGEEAAFVQLVNQYNGSMLRLSMSFVSSQAVASEVVQEAWLGVLSGLAKFEGRSTLKTWIFRILTNRAKTRGVREGRTVPFSALAREDDGQPLEPERFTSRGRWATPPAPWGVTSPEALLEQKQAMAALVEAVEQLPPNQRAVVTLRDLDGWESPDVCNALDISETNQRVLLHRGRTRVRVALEKHLAGN